MKKLLLLILILSLPVHANESGAFATVLDGQKYVDTFNIEKIDHPSKGRWVYTFKNPLSNKNYIVKIFSYESDLVGGVVTRQENTGFELLTINPTTGLETDSHHTVFVINP